MYWLQRALLGCFFCFVCCWGFAQVDTVSLTATVVRDTTVKMEERFNYVFPPSDRPNKLLERLLDTIQKQSIDPIKTIQSMSIASHIAGNPDAGIKNERPTWVLFTVFTLFLVVSVVRLLFPADFMRIVLAYFHERTLLQVSKEDNMLTSWPYIFLYLTFSFALGLFVILVESSFAQLEVLNWQNYMRITLFVAIVFVVKILLIRFISFVFELEKLTREYVTVLYLVYFNSMLILMPFLLIVTFIPAQYFKFVLILFAAIAVILFIYRFLRTAFRLFGNVKFSIFYLILYLCALEVAPILILVKTLGN